MAVNEERRNSLVGGATMLALLAVIGLVYVDTAHQKSRGYDLTARFNKAEGIAVGADVRLSGVVVGKVAKQALDERFRAILTLKLDPSVRLPTDSTASIQTDGLLGSKYVSLAPGGDEKDLKAGDTITYTQDSLALEDLLAMIIGQAESARGGAAE